MAGLFNVLHFNTGSFKVASGLRLYKQQRASCYAHAQLALARNLLNYDVMIKIRTRLAPERMRLMHRGQKGHHSDDARWAINENFSKLCRQHYKRLNTQKHRCLKA